MSPTTNLTPRVRRIVLLPAPAAGKRPEVRRWRLARVGEPSRGPAAG